jgi:hypothetical protein
MSNLNRFTGMLIDINNERMLNVIGKINTAISSGASVSRVFIDAYNGPLMPKGSSIQIKPRYTSEVKLGVLSSDLESGDTQIDLESFTAPFDIPANTRIFFNNFYALNHIYKRFFVEHIHMFETGTTHGNDLLINSQEPGGGKYNHDAGATLTTGSSYSNNWGTKFSVLNVPSFKCKLERIIYSCSSNGTTNEDWTISLWKKPINPNSTTASTITLINEQEIICQNNASYVHYIEVELNENLDAGMAIIPSFKKSGSKQTSSTKHYADITLIFSYYDA